jgi:hypothetical protein
MAEIVQAWPVACFRRTQSDLTGQDIKHSMNTARIQTTAAAGHEEVINGLFRNELVPSLDVLRQDLLG